MSSQLIPYDKRALAAIYDWRHAEIGFHSKTLKTLTKPIDMAGELIFDAPYIGKAVEGAISGGLTVLNDVAQHTVRNDAILNDFHKHNYLSIHEIPQIHNLRLEAVDNVVGNLDIKYKLLAAGEGAVTSVGGLPFIAADVALLISLSLRATLEYGTYYGFDVSRQHERAFAMRVLALASSPTDGGKVLTMVQLNKIAKEVAKKRAWKDLEKYASVKAMQKAAQVVGVQLTKKKLAQAIPIAGIVVGGTFNAHFINKVCITAQYLYQERFLAEAYGAHIIDMKTRPQ